MSEPALPPGVDVPAWRRWAVPGVLVLVAVGAVSGGLGLPRSLGAAVAGQLLLWPLVVAGVAGALDPSLVDPPEPRAVGPGRRVHLLPPPGPRLGAWLPDELLALVRLQVRVWTAPWRATGPADSQVAEPAVRFPAADRVTAVAWVLLAALAVEALLACGQAALVARSVAWTALAVIAHGYAAAWLYGGWALVRSRAHELTDSVLVARGLLRGSLTIPLDAITDIRLEERPVRPALGLRADRASGTVSIAHGRRTDLRVVVGGSGLLLPRALTHSRTVVRARCVDLTVDDPEALWRALDERDKL
ncbi:MAG: hypothetical protein JWM48_641 [Mycobacterium sp.]|nr:hypothetical protein [Mycobacterium sp.]